MGWAPRLKTFSFVNSNAGLPQPMFIFASDINISMTKIILEDRFTNHQKTMFLLYITVPTVLGLIRLWQLNLLNSLMYVIIFILFPTYLFLTTIAFLKRGFIEKDAQLYIGSFFQGKLYFKKKIDISNRTGLCILKFKSSRKYVFFSLADPDLAHSFYRHEINLLNEMHTRRNPIMSLLKKENSEKAAEFLTTHFPLKREKYNPRFGRKW
jgi:hypothetical protein